jgi:hypothetical protein
LLSTNRGSWRWARWWTRCRKTRTCARSTNLGQVRCTNGFARDRLLPAVRANTSLRQFNVRAPAGTGNEFLHEAEALVAARNAAAAP